MISAAEEIVEFEKKVREYEQNANESLRRFHNRTHYEPTTEYTALDSVIAAEEGTDDEDEIRRETISRMFQYFAADGPHPAKVLRRVYAVGVHMAISPFCDLTVRERGMLLNESHGSQHWIMGKICSDPLRRKGAKSWKAPGQKTLRSRGSYSRCQKGNKNRKKKQ